jgi:hypothetical protein
MHIEEDEEEEGGDDDETKERKKRINEQKEDKLVEEIEFAAQLQFLVVFTVFFQEDSRK